MYRYDEFDHQFVQERTAQFRDQANRRLSGALTEDEFRPLRLLHGRGTVFGYRFGAAAYLTDHSDIPEEALAQLQGLDVLFLDALRHKPHPTHSTVERSVAYAQQLKPRRAYFTHICHELPHARTESALPPNIRLAYDGLEITVGAAQ